jgi:hypothetical protein
MRDAAPRINVLRNDGKVPRTSDCFTPRTLEGNDGAFKGPEYGCCVQGPYRAPGLWAMRILWALAVALLIASAVTVLLLS